MPVKMGVMHAVTDDMAVIFKKSHGIISRTMNSIFIETYEV
jgi:hypothetical protein